MTGPELCARRTYAAGVLDGYLTAAASAPLTRPPAPAWALRLADALSLILEALGDADDQDDDDGLEPCCVTCGERIGMFRSLDGWRHYRGTPVPGGRRVLYDAGHQPAPGWCTPPCSSVSPAGAALIGQALADAEAFRRERAAVYCYDCVSHPAGACEAHVGDLDQAGAYRDLAGVLAKEDR